MNTTQIGKQSKYEYNYVIQQHYGQGWEDVSQYETNSTGRKLEMTGKVRTDKRGREHPVSLLSHDRSEYQLTGYPTRTIFRKSLQS